MMRESKQEVVQRPGAVDGWEYDGISVEAQGICCGEAVIKLMKQGCAYQLINGRVNQLFVATTMGW
jgi:hypothetical protein